jgi:hypothetical protein
MNSSVVATALCRRVEGPVAVEAEAPRHSEAAT